MELFSKLILTYLFPIECHVKHNLAKQNFELTEFSNWLPHLSQTAIMNYFPSAGMLGGQPNQGWQLSFFFNWKPVGPISDSMTVPT